MTEQPSDPREKRNGVILRAAVARDGASVERRVRNLSAHGACIDNMQDLAEGDVVDVTMGVLRDIVADVVWAKPQLAGLKFRTMVDLEAARQPRAALAPTSGWMTDIRDPYRKPR